MESTIEKKFEVGIFFLVGCVFLIILFQLINLHNAEAASPSWRGYDDEMVVV